MADTRFRAPPVDALRFEPLGALTAIFDRRSMQTHLVAPPVPEILAALATGPCDAAALGGRLAEAFDLEAGVDVAALLSERLAELAAMGLVETA